MHPLADLEIDSSIPANASYWVPKPSDITDEGFGYFRDVWPLVGARAYDVTPLLAWERRAAAYVASESEDVLSFDALARGVENYMPDADDNEAELPAELQADWTSLAGLELGVSGLAHALSNAGFYPAASCRSHPDRNWTNGPIVLFASDRERLARLHPLAEATDCGLAADATRGDPLFAIYARSIVELMDLAQQLFEDRSEFRAIPKTDRKQSKPGLRRPDRQTLF
ncbi:hypothetical protein [Arthrobacter sp. 2MCAF14]|uniref:hypothetical protein n=1 Tax=Arthrobacter sp. 2MCAF14 TaxID=3232982 RepID=UPI003F92D3AF